MTTRKIQTSKLVLLMIVALACTLLYYKNVHAASQEILHTDKADMLSQSSSHIALQQTKTLNIGVLMIRKNINTALF